MSRMVSRFAIQEGGDMNSTLPTPLPASQASPPVSGPRWLAAIGAAIAIQVAAAMTALLAVAIFLVAALEDWGNRGDEGMPAYALLSIPIGAAAPCVFVLSGVAASRIIGDNRGCSFSARSPGH
jgi:hypothetical protein